MNVKFEKLGNGIVKVNIDQLQESDNYAGVTAPQYSPDVVVLYIKGHRYDFNYKDVTELKHYELGLLSLPDTRDELIIILNTFFYYSSAVTQLAVDTQSPVAVNTDSVYLSDVDFDNSDFSGWIGDPANLFKSPFSDAISNTSSDNPKQIILAFKRTMQALQIGLGDNTNNKFSNVKISLLGSGGQTRTIKDDSLDSTKRSSYNPTFIHELFNSVLLEFYTADPVYLTNITIQKSSYNVSQIQGIDSKGNLQTFASDRQGQFKVALTAQEDDFGKIKVSEPYTIMEGTMVSQYALEHYWSNAGTGSITYDQATSKALLSVNTGEWIINQTKQRFQYQAGKSYEQLYTYVATMETGVIKRIGLIDYDNYNEPVIDFDTPQNGVGIIIDGTVNKLGFEIWNNGVLFEHEWQENWNVDKLDGTGASGFILDINKFQISFGGLEWLGGGRVRVGFNIDGLNLVVHEFNHSNRNITDVYMRTANLPISYALKGVSSAASLKQVCNTVISNGGYNLTGAIKSVFIPSFFAVSDGVTELAIGIRYKPSDISTMVLLSSFGVIAQTKNDGLAQVVLNPVYSETVTWIDKPNSSIQYAINNNNVVSDRGLEMSELIPIGSNTNSVFLPIKNTLRIGKGIDGVYDEAWLIVTAIGGNDSYLPILNYIDLI